jgi:hypothetical protein
MVFRILLKKLILDDPPFPIRMAYKKGAVLKIKIQMNINTYKKAFPGGKVARRRRGGLP